MNKHLQPLIITALASLSALGGALAQTTEGIDLEAVRAQALHNAADAEALASTARDRAKALTQAATQSTEAARANGRSFAARPRRPDATGQNFDFDQMVADAGDMARQSMGDAPRFIAFASLSMPPDALSQMVDDVRKAGGVVVFRGLAQGSAKAMAASFAKVIAHGQSSEGVGIDPRLFRAFGVDQVPAYVVVASDFELCSGFDCAENLPPYDILHGNVTARYALERIAEGGGPGAAIAAQHLARFAEVQP